MKKLVSLRYLDKTTMDRITNRSIPEITTPESSTVKTFPVTEFVKVKNPSALATLLSQYWKGDPELSSKIIFDPVRLELFSLLP